MKIKTKSMYLMCLVTGIGLVAGATQIADPVSSDWTSPYGGMQWGTVGGLDPVEPGWQFSSLNWGGGDKLTWKLFSGNTYIEENLKVTYYMGERTDGLGFPSSSYLNIGLFADVNADGSWSLDEMILPSTSSNPVPSDAWEQWVDTYEITAATTTTGGSNVLGKAIGFCVYADGGGVNKSMAFDSLLIETYEPPERESTLITDEVSGGESGWIDFAGGFVWGTTGGLDPVEGGWQFSTINWGGNDKGGWKLFEEDFIEENLQVTYYMGERTDGNGFPSSAYLQTRLFADVNEDGSWSLDEMIVPNVSSNPIPSDGWEQWVDAYEITASTTTVGGSNVLGKTIGFCVYANGGGVDRSMAFDSLVIETVDVIVPTPAHLSVSQDGSNIVIAATELYPLSSVSNVLEKTVELSSDVWTSIMPYSIGSESNSWTVAVDDDAAFFRIRSLY